MNKAIYHVPGITMEGREDLLGIWLVETDGAKFGLSFLIELQQSGLKDIFIAIVDGLTGFMEAIRYRKVLPNDVLATKVVYLAIQVASQKRVIPTTVPHTKYKYTYNVIIYMNALS